MNDDSFNQVAFIITSMSFLKVFKWQNFKINNFFLLTKKIIFFKFYFSIFFCREEVLCNNER